jgi:hypothetical protein
MLGSAEFGLAQLSTRWLEACSNLIETSGGPIFARALGGSLERFSIECAPGMCSFAVSDIPLFHSVLLTSGQGNSPALLSHFGALLGQESEQLAPPHYPAALLLNTFAPGVSEQDREAMFQLAYHFAGAYFSWARA